MNPGKDASRDSATPEDVTIAEKIAFLCKSFERAWDTENPPHIEHYLEGLPDTHRAAALRALLEIELKLRRRDGQSPTPQEYGDRFPGHAEIIQTAFQPSSAEETVEGLLSQHAMTPAPIQSGSEPRKLGDYELSEKIGRGGMGVVYKGHHPILDMDVAIKLLHPHLVQNPEAASRFLREARLAARLNHPEIVRVFDCGKHQEHYFLVMEFVDGQNLTRFIESHGTVPVRRALEIAEAVARALSEALNQVGVIHRDVKPDNIMLTSGGQVKLTDLGLAKAAAEHAALIGTGSTTPGIALGTPRYMSPEQFADSSQVDHRADIFSLGATLYHMVAGRPPFEGVSVFSILKAVEEDDPPPLPGHVPVEVEELIRRMLAKNAEERFQTYDELIEAIQDVSGRLRELDELDERKGELTRTQIVIPSAKIAGRILRPASPTENRVLLVVDVQNDFCPDGALAVPRGDEVVPVVNDLTRRFSHVILTQDWHCDDHLSFASSHPGKKPLETTELSYGPQILWPDHCVQKTRGSEFHPDLNVAHCEMIIRKGYHREIDSYSAFFENDRQTPTGLAGYLRERGLTRLFIVGLATDFCVAYTALDARKLGFEVTVIEEGCRGIDVDGSLESAWEQMSDAGVVRA